MMYKFKIQYTFYEKGTWAEGRRTGTVIAKTLKQAEEKIKNIDDEYGSITNVEFEELTKEGDYHERN